MESILKATTHQVFHLVGMASLFVYPAVYGFDTLYFTALFAGFLLKSFVISAYNHRCIAHRSWNAPEWLHYPMLVLGAIFLMFPAFTWAAVHRKHHTFADTMMDVHGPTVGMVKTFGLSFLKPERKFYRVDMRNEKMRWQLQNYWKIFIIGAGLISLLISPAFYLIAMGYVYSSQTFVNVIGHYKSLRNSHVMSIFTGGEMYHEHHHSYPQDPRFGLLDLGYYGMIKWLNLKD